MTSLLIFSPCSNFPIVLTIDFIAKGFHPGSGVAFGLQSPLFLNSSPVCLVLLGPWHFWRVLAIDFLECPLIWICLMFPPSHFQVMQIRQKYHAEYMGSFSGITPGSTWCSLVLLHHPNHNAIFLFGINKNLVGRDTLWDYLNIVLPLKLLSTRFIF